MFRLRIAPLVIGFLLLLIAAGCGGSSNSSGSGSNGSGSGGSNGGSSGGSGGGGESTSPTVSNFALTPRVAAPGQFVNFTWTTTNATSISVTPSIVNSGQDDGQALPLQAAPYTDTGIPTSTTTFQAMASSGTTNSQPASATLTIVPMNLTASPNPVQAGNPVTLTYSGPNNGSTYVLTTLPANTTTPLTPSCSGNTCTATYTTPTLNSNTRYQVSAKGPVGSGNSGTAVSPTVLVTVNQPTTLTFTANPQTVLPGGAVTLSWTTTNATSVSINQGLGTVAPPLGVSMGSYCCVHPQTTTTYTATATSIYPNTPPVPATATVTVSTGGVSNLNHIIYLVQENRAFDNYLGVLAEYRVNHIPPIPGAQLSDVNDLHTLPQGYTIKNPQGQAFGPFHQRTECIENLSPSWDETHYDMDLVGNDWMDLTVNSQYLMDRFLDTTLSGGTGDQYDPTHSRPLGYYDQSDLPFLYELTTQFSSSDTWYSPIAANTVPNRMYLFAATSWGHGYPPNSPSDPAWQRPTFFRALTQAGITWRYYYQDNSVFLANWADWNDPQIQGNVRNIAEYYNILASPSADTDLPQVVFIERAASTELDEHPGNNVQTGSADVQTILNALLTSAAWPDSAFILTYDEGGGLFDHVGPILVTPPDDQLPTDLQGHTQGLFNVTGFRVPVVVVSPWSKPHTISHMPTDYTSILKLIETRYNVPALTQRDATTGDMTDPSAGFFDFTAPNMLTVPPLPIQPTNGTCNYQLEGAPQ
jgi:phospholipase C